MRGPANLRSYGLLVRDVQVLIAREMVGPVLARKFPGGGVEAGETPEANRSRGAGAPAAPRPGDTHLTVDRRTVYTSVLRRRGEWRACPATA